MGKTVKNLLLVFTLVCVIAFVVFTIELFVINRDAGDGAGNKQSVSGNAAGNASGETKSASQQSPPGSSSIGTASNNTGNANNIGELQTQSQLHPAGRRYLLPISSNEAIALYADEELFEHNELELADIFIYKGEGKATLEACFVSLPQGAQKTAENYLDGYLDGNESFVGDTGPIRHSPLSGVFVSGVNGGETFEAWIYSIPDDDSDTLNDIGMAFVIRYSDNEQRDALFAVLDSLELAPI